uniref:Uncharacterized protein n=1 Tax=Anguilla anguilla TaxID=7936 RepID=A0A0E9PC79_ANGAN
MKHTCTFIELLRQKNIYILRDKINTLNLNFIFSYPHPLIV